MRKTPQTAGSTTDSPAQAAGPLSRRRLFAGAGTAGALAAAATLLPQAHTPEPAAAADPAPAPEGGYRLTAHVQQYYRTAKV